MGQLLPVVRRSDVESYGCPYRYDKLVNDGVDDSGDEAIRGRAVHAAHYVYILLLAQHQVAQDFELAKEAFIQGLAISPVPHHLIDECERLFFRHVERFELDLDRYYSAEEIITRKLGGRRFQPDLLYVAPQEVEIVDIKTYYKALTEIQARKELQLRWYLVEAVRAFPNFPRYRFTFWFIRLNVKVSLSFTAEDIAAFEPGVDAQIAAVERARETGEYPPLPGSHCTLCRLSCPVQDQVDRLPGRILDRDQAVQIGGQILAAEQRLKALKKIMGGFCSVDGPVEVNGQVFKHDASTAISYPAALIVDLSAEYDQPLGLTFSHPEVVRQLLKPAALTEDDHQKLAEAATSKTTYRLRHCKVGEVEPEDTTDILAGVDDD